jgi:hypothetical protein
MTLNPAALLLLVVGVVAVIVGVKGTQRTAAQLLTGRSASGAPSTGAAIGAGAGAAFDPGTPTNSHPATGAQGPHGPVGP